MVIYFTGAFFFIWLVVLSWFVIKTRKHYYKLINNTKKEKIDEILETLIDFDIKSAKEIDQLKKNLREEVEKSRVHIRKIGLVRYNPFDRIGGEQSFVLSLLNDKNSGLLINFIYTRDGLRVYSKKVTEGSSQDRHLSDEEKEAIKVSS